MKAVAVSERSLTKGGMTNEGAALLGVILWTQEDFDPVWCCQFEWLVVRISKVEAKVALFSSKQFFCLWTKKANGFNGIACLKFERKAGRVFVSMHQNQ